MNKETVRDVEHYTDDLFWFLQLKVKYGIRKFKLREFTMIGMPKIAH